MITVLYGALMFVGASNVWFSGTMDWDTADHLHWHCDSPVTFNYSGGATIRIFGVCYQDTVFKNGF